MSISTIEIKIVTKGKSGNINGYVVLETDYPKNKFLKMTFDGICEHLEGKLESFPKSLSFGEVIKGQIAKRSLLLTRKSKESLDYIGATSTISGITVSQVRTNSDLIELAIYLDTKELPFEEFKGELKVLTDHYASPELIVPVIGKIVGELQAYPSSVYLKCRKNKTAEITVKINNLLGKPFEIMEVKLEPISLLIESSCLQKEPHEWHINFICNELEKPKSIEEGLISILTTDNDKIEIPLFLF